VTNADLRWWYRRYNKKYFAGKLPAAKVKFAKLAAGELGTMYHGLDEVYITKEFRKWPREAKFTLLHEMVHLALPVNAWHGPSFEKEMLRLAKAGAFKGLW
jgi:hypothetical protein